jgi:hypothetical protein
MPFQPSWCEFDNCRVTGSGSTLTLIKGALKIMSWTSAKTAVGLGVLLAAATVTALVEKQIEATQNSVTREPAQGASASPTSVVIGSVLARLSQLEGF